MVAQHEAGIRHSWEQTHKKNYKNTIYRFKKKAIKEVGGDDPMELQNVVPKNMLSCDWEAICKGYMSAPNYQEKCRKAKLNRLSEKDGSSTKHTGTRWETGKEIEVHDRTHRKRKGHGEYVDNKSKRVREEYEREYISQHDSNPTPESSFNTQKWVEISGGPCKDRLYGFGNTYHCRELIAVDRPTETISTTPQPNYVTQEQMQEAITKAIDEGFSRERKRSTEEAQARDEAMKAMMTALGIMMAKFNALESASSSHTNEGGENEEFEDRNDN